jgi:vancomycin resistance protein YoaR
VTIKLPIITTSPAIRTADVNTLGIKEIIGKGISYFRGSIPSRIHNIQLASSKLNGILIPPGETFSFNQALGEVSQSTGYKEAYIIKEGRTVLGDGGGVCQVSTTLFRAALNAGLPIVERHAHAYRVSYYEQSSDVGLDATVFDPTADLKIKNDTPTHILIQAQVDTKKNTLIFELYGASDGRKATISKSRAWDQIPPPPDLYQDDPTLPPGKVKQIDWKAWGAKVAFDYRVERNGEILQNRTFYSNYRPWQAIYLRGPGTIQ